MDVPVVETERLILRGHTAADFPAYAAMWADPDVTRYITGKPLSEEDAWAKLMRAAGHWDLLGFGFWSVHEKQGGARVGETGFLAVKRAMEPSLEGTPEVGWAFAKAAQGKGYATEAVRAVHSWGERKFGKVRYACIISPENVPSLRVAERTGYKIATTTIYHNDPILVLYRDP
jgi:RimJ/RimL family protein N-acetyltransferase